MKKARYKAVVKETPHGYELSLYKRGFWGWAFEAGLVPMFEPLSLINEYLERWKNMYGDDLMVKDCRNA